MRLSLRVKIVVLSVLGLTLVAGGAAVWWQRTALLSWYYVRCLSQANEADREVCAERVIALDEAGVAALLDGLSQPDAMACGNVAVALDMLGRRWTSEEPRWQSLVAHLAESMDRASPQGQIVLVKLLAAWLQPTQEDQPPSPFLIDAAGQALAKVVSSPPSEVHTAALGMAEKLLEIECPPEVLGDCRGLVQACLRDDDAANRVLAVRLSVHPGLGLLEQAVALLQDSNPEVRREVMLATRLAPETVVKTDDLLHWLHDSDEDVRRLCEAVLTMRGMTKEQVKLGRMLTHNEATVRLGVLEVLQTADDLEPGVWLRLLSVDPEPAIRVAAVRFASLHPLVDLSDRIDQMAQSDPSPTVRQLAQSYLKMPQPHKGFSNRP